MFCVGRLGPLGRATVLAVVVLGAAACASEDDGGGLSTGDDPGSLADVELSGESSPFAVGHEPDGYRLVQAGIGTYGQTWSSDSFGDDEPVTVLAPPGEGAESRDAVWISVTGFEGYEGGLAQASYGYTEHVEEFVLDGRPAVFAAARTEDGAEVPADLVVEAGDDLAVRVTRWEATRDELADIARLVAPAADHLEAPEVPEPPDGLEVVGSADADVAISLVYPPTPASMDLPAGERSHVAVWASGDPGEAWSVEEGIVKVVTLPGYALDLPAVGAALLSQGVAPERPQVEERGIAGRPGVIYELDGGLRAALTYTAGGDVLMVVAMGEDLPEADDLVDVAASVEATSDGDWDRFVSEARGGGELEADDGAVELERGTADGVEWLLQARQDSGDDSTLHDGGYSSDDPDTAGEFLVDPCLKLADGRRACADHGSGNANHQVFYRAPGLDENDTDFSGYVVAMTISPASTMRITTADGEELTAPLHELPGGDRRAGIVMIDRNIDIPTCPQRDTGSTGDEPSVAFLDADGDELPCTD